MPALPAARRGTLADRRLRIRCRRNSRLQAHDAFEQRCLAHAVAAHQAHARTGGNSQIHVPQSVAAAVKLVEGFNCPACSHSKIDFDDAGVLLHLIHVTFRDHVPFVQHHDPPGNRSDEGHIMLHHHHRMLARQRYAAVPPCARSPAASYRPPARPPAAVPDSASAACRFRATVSGRARVSCPNASALVREADDVRGPRRFCSCCAGVDPGAQCFQERPACRPTPVRGSRTPSTARTQSAFEIFVRFPRPRFPARTFEQIDVVAKPRRPRIRPSFPRDDVHHGRLAGAVGADDAKHLSRIDVQREVVERLKAVEADGQVLKLSLLSRTLTSLYSAECRSPIIPRGRNSVTSTNNAPSAYSHTSGKAPVR